VIGSFKDKETEAVFQRQFTRKLPNDIQRPALRKLVMIDSATDLRDLQIPPANRLEALSGNRKGQHSIRINQQWRVCFRWDKGNAWDVEIVDYH
jgi:toxin HigB-1